jgi:membrane protease YdiL (CAAX protease family)
MDSWVLISLLSLVFVDFYLLRGYDKENFLRTIELNNRGVYFVLIFLALTGIIFGQVTELIGLVFTVGFMPLYLIRRRSYFRSLSKQENEKDKKFFYLSDAIGVILTWFFCWATSIFLVSGLWELLGNPSRFDQLVISAVISTAVILVVVRMAARRFEGNNFWENIECIVSGKSPLRMYIIPSMFGLMFAGISTWLVLNRSVQPQTPLGELMESAESSFFMVIFIMLAVMVAPFIEEVVFRGYFYRIIKRISNTWTAVIFIGLFFGMLHVEQYWGDWAAIFMIGIIGLVLTWVRAWAGTVVAGIVMHYVYNISVVILPIIMIFLTNPTYVKYSVFYENYNFKEKEALLKESIDNQPGFADAYNELAWLYAEEKYDLNEALSLINKALALEPERAAFLDTKAEILEKAGRSEESLAIRKKLLSKPLPPSFHNRQLEKIKSQDQSINK